MSLKKTVCFNTAKMSPSKAVESLFCYPEICTMFISDLFSILNPGLNYLPSSDKKKREEKIRREPLHLLSEGIYLPFSCPQAEVTHQWTIRQGHSSYAGFELISYSVNEIILESINDRSLFFFLLIIDAQNLNFHLPYRHKQRGLYLLFSGVYLIGTASAATKERAKRRKSFALSAFREFRNKSVQVLACTLLRTEEGKEDG